VDDATGESTAVARRYDRIARLSPLVQRLVGPAINRRTEDNIRAAGLELVEVSRHGVWREIHARQGSE